MVSVSILRKAISSQGSGALTSQEGIMSEVYLMVAIGVNYRCSKGGYNAVGVTLIEERAGILLVCSISTQCSNGRYADFRCGYPPVKQDIIRQASSRDEKKPTRC